MGTTLSISDIGIARSKDGIHFHGRRRFIVPELAWEKFGCEDPRATLFNKKYYIFYTALSTYPFGAQGIKVGLAISKDLKAVEEKHLITPFNAKAMALFPGRIRGKMYAVLTVHTDRPPARICLAAFDKESDLWSEAYWWKWYTNFETHALALLRAPQDHIEVGAPPIKTKYGWLLMYSYIKNYFSGQKVFGIEVALLDTHDPSKIIGKTNAPLIVAEEYYERIGLAPDIVFPSGALLKGKEIMLYYGAADTTCAMAYITLSDLHKTLLKKEKPVACVRAKQNPIISPIAEHDWEAKATFNPGAILLEGKVHILYRAMSRDNTSVFGYARSDDGVHIEYRSSEPVYAPREPFEQKLVPGGNSGCEDPRITLIGNTIYMCYTAFDGKNPPRVAFSRIPAKDFLKEKWSWAHPVLISPPDMDDKDACLFSEKVNGKYCIIHRSGNDIDLAFSPTLDFDGKTWLEEYRWVAPRKGTWDGRKVGAVASPIKTAKGWILFYHGVSEEDGVYRVGVLLLDRKDPTKVLARSHNPIFEPETRYEKEGEVPNVVFPCGAILLGEDIFLYYGGADRVVGVAAIKIKELFKNLV
ncbi:MAG: putative glycosidase ph1107 protein [Parcubacteria group bacterium Gr01-1014_33]|nr:MAG: putative glycosidase ph1107 protein [Parcubacteria group bacterium Gr01-1014_33]